MAGATCAVAVAPAGLADTADAFALRTVGVAEIDVALSEPDFAGPVERVVEVGAPAPILAEQSRSVDSLVCGGRGVRVRAPVLLGGVSARLIRTAACPVIVVPRGA